MWFANDLSIMVVGNSSMKINNTNGLFWFRNDQRLSDNLALFRLCAEADRLLPVFVIEPHWFEARHLMAKPVGQHRLNFLLQSLTWLQQELQQLGSDLLIVEGVAETEIVNLIKQHRIAYLGCSTHPGVYEKRQLKSIMAAAPQLTVLQEDSNTLFNLTDLPFTLDELPKHFTPFRKKVEQLKIDSPMKAPQWMPPLPESAQGLARPVTSQLTQSSDFQGGGNAAKERLQYYTYGSCKVLTYKQTRNGMLAFDDSSKLSPWLANGNISAKEIYQKIRLFEADVEANESTYWLYFELLWREYFQWYLHKHGNKVFRFSGVKGASPLTSFWPERFEKWRSGNTPWPIVNAAMRQLNQTGYMSNRGRQLVASCLVHELNLDWRYGAAWFEQQLIDYDVASNWGNWQYLAGVGADPRGHRRFDLEKQARQYDPEQHFVRAWLSDEEILEAPQNKLDSTDMVDWPG